MIIKRFALGIVTATFLIGAADYTKHFLLKKSLMNIKDLTQKESSITLGRNGFYIAYSDVSYKQKVHLKKARLKIPFLAFNTVVIRGNGLTFEHFSSKALKVICDYKKDDYRISSLHFLHNRLNTLNNEFVNQHIYGRAHFFQKTFKFSIHATMIQKKKDNLFALTCYGGVKNPLDPTQEGKINFKVTHFKNLLMTFMNGTSGWKRSLIEKAFGDNVVVPLTLQGADVLLGPLKIVNLSQFFDLEAPQHPQSPSQEGVEDSTQYPLPRQTQGT